MRMMARLIAISLLMSGVSVVAATSTGGQVDRNGWGVWAVDTGKAGSVSRDRSGQHSRTVSSSPPEDYVMRTCPRTDECVSEGVSVQLLPTAKPKGRQAREPGKSDVARFLVGTPGITVEPAQWTVAGAETNFVATSAGARTNSGTLLGQPVRVQFAAVVFHWNYGDGETRNTSVPGAGWKASAQLPFTATPTSHVFATRGRYTVTVTVDFTARYQFAGEGWRSIAGTLPLTSKPVVVTVKSASTVLVGHNCAERPSGPGCSP